MNQAHCDILRAVLSSPTAPFCEQAVIATVLQWATSCGVEASRDRAGNIFLRYRGGKARRPRWFFTAHLDHPGFCVVRSTGHEVWAEFRGGVAKDYFPGSKVRFFVAGENASSFSECCAKVLEISAADPFPICRLKLNSDAALPVGTFGMWDLPACEIRGTKIISRACDDLAGVAAVLCAMESIARAQLPADVTGLLTRGEEAGFVGALAACKSRSVPRGALVVSIETSKQQPAAALGDGAVVRVGDRTRTFDPTLTAHLASVAGEVAKQDSAFRFARQLMPGGTCESTAFCMAGYTAAAVCLPLDNYHNMGPRNRIASERVDLNDFESLVKLLVALAAEPRTPGQTDERLQKNLAGLLRERAKYLRQPMANRGVI